MKQVSYIWSLVVGLISVIWQVASYYFRFGQLNPYSPLIDYVLFFGAGVLGGLVLIYFLNRQTTPKGWWAVMAAFLLATPVAMVFILGGGLLGFIGILIFPLIPWAFITWIGSLVGKRLS